MVSDLEHPNVKHLVTIHLSMSWLVTVHLAGWIDQRSISIKCFFFWSFYFSLFERTLNKQDQIEYCCFGEFCLKIMGSTNDQEGKWGWLRS